MNKLVFNSETNEMQVVALTAEEIEQNEIDKSTVISPQPPSETELLKQENAVLQLALADTIEKQEIDKISNQIALAEVIETLTIKGVL